MIFPGRSPIDSNPEVVVETQDHTTGFVAALTKYKWLVGSVFVLIIAVLGTISVLMSHAATLTTGFEAENGVISAPATLVTDPTASQRHAVQFSSGPVAPVAGSPGVGFSVPDYPNFTSAQQVQYFADMKSRGITWVRYDIGWNHVQKQKGGPYEWSFVDTFVNNAAQAGLKVDGIMDGPPSWAKQANCVKSNVCPPADPAAYAAFAAAAVQHYGTKLSAVEIMNEPNIYQFWAPLPNAAQYVALLKASYTAIKAVNPTMTVLTAGLSPAITDSKGHYINQFTYLKQMYALGAKNYFDALAYHPYTYPLMPSAYSPGNPWSQMTQTPVSLASIMASNGDAAKKIWITEYGAPTGGPGTALGTCANLNVPARSNVDQCLQAKLLANAITTARTSDKYGPIFLYSYIDKGTSASTQENHFGVLNHDGSRKQSYTAVKQAISQ